VGCTVILKVHASFSRLGLAAGMRTDACSDRFGFATIPAMTPRLDMTQIGASHARSARNVQTDCEIAHLVLSPSILT
jgi:hypothetical protein